MKWLILAFTLLVNCVAPLPASCNTVEAQTSQLVRLRPDDCSRPYLTVFGNAENLQRAAQWFKSAAHWRAWKARTRFNMIDTGSAIFKARYADSTPADCLTIRIQEADGRITYEVCDGNIVINTLSPLVNHECLNGRCRARQDGDCPGGVCPTDLQLRNLFKCPRKEQPQPQQQLDPEPTPIVAPAIEPEPEAQHFPWFLLVIGIVIAAVLGVAREYKRQYR